MNLYLCNGRGINGQDQQSEHNLKPGVLYDEK